MSFEVEHKSDIKQQLHEACHDMRQPIAVTLALAAAALTEPNLPDATRERLERIIEQSEWLVDIINGCLAARGQVEADEIKNPDHDLADIVQVIGEVIAAKRVTWPGEVALSAPAGPVWCAVPPVPLRRAISNVLDNAARAAGPTGTVTVEIQQREDTVMLAVEDDGPGFGKIPSGASLGLSTVARNVVMYGGRMECSGGMPRGARVSLWLP